MSINKEYVTVLSTDMSKAFDSLHPMHTNDLNNFNRAYGFSETSLNLLRSFLERRVKLQEAHSWGVRKAPPSGLYFGTCSKVISRYIGSLQIYICMRMIIKYTNDNDVHIREEREA